MQTFGVIVTTRSFFPSHLIRAAREEIIAKLDGLGYGAVMVSESDTEYGAVCTLEEAKTCARLFRERADDISGLIVILPNFGDEQGVAEAIDRAKLDVPVLVAAADDDLDKFDIERRRDAFCGKLSVCHNLRQRGIPFTNTSLHTCRFGSDTFTDDLTRFAAVCRVVTGVRGARIAALGARPGAFATVRYSEKILQQHKISVQTVDLSEVMAKAMSLSDQAVINEKVSEIRAYGSIPSGIGEDKIEKQARLCLAVDAMVSGLDCQASAVQCWDSIQNNYGCAACLSMSMMGEAGKPSACESDVTGALTMLAMQLASGRAPAYMDWNNNLGDDRDDCVCQHCSNFPKSFFGGEMEIECLDVLGSTLGKDRCFGACKGIVAPGPMTYCKVTTDDTRGVLKLYVGEGEFLPGEFLTKGGVARCRVPGLQELMDHLCQNGYEHHVCFARGHVAGVIAEAFGRYLGAEVYWHKGN